MAMPDSSEDRVRQVASVCGIFGEHKVTTA
jgi:hypothetical protein